MRARASGRRAGFTLIELLVVITIILLVSIVGLASGILGNSSRQLSEAARVLQGAIVGARDRAIHDGQPSGLRLVPDPAFDSIDPATGLLDPTRPLAYSRIIPLDVAPEYSEGAVTVRPGAAYLSTIHNPDGDPSNTGVAVPSLVLEQAVTDARGAPNSPTSWAWNVRVGDRLQIHGSGQWYTVCGPMWAANPEGFINWGPIGKVSPLNPTGKLPLEWLILVNGRDDNLNGYVDDGWDGVDNDGDGTPDETSCKISTVGEWEAESWNGAAAAGMVSVPYALRRRPMPGQASREVTLPTQVVIDATTGLAGGAQERSRLPINSANGNVDLMVNPDGTVFYSTPYGSPSSVGLGGTFLHFWLAMREDVTGPSTTATASPFLPIAQPGGTNAAGFPGPYLKGDYSVLTLNARTGLLSVNASPPFLDSSGNYNAAHPFLGAEQGVNSGP